MVFLCLCFALGFHRLIMTADLTNADDRSGLVRSGMDVMVNAEVEMWKRGCCGVVEMR